VTKNVCISDTKSDHLSIELSTPPNEKVLMLFTATTGC